MPKADDGKKKKKSSSSYPLDLRIRGKNEKDSLVH